MSNIDKYNVFLSKTKNKKQKFNIKNYASILSSVSFFVILCLNIWLFIFLIIPPVAGHSQASFFNTTSFYSVKYSLDFSGFKLSLTTMGFVLIVVMFFAILLSIVAINVNIGIINNKSKKNKKIWIKRSGWIFLIVVTILFFIFVLIPPNVKSVAQSLREQLLVNDALNSITSNPITIQDLKLICDQLGISYSQDATFENLIVSIETHTILYQFSYTPFYLYVSGACVASNSIYSVYVLFAVTVFYFFLSKVIFYFSVHNLSLSNKLNKENIDLLVKNYKKSQQEKQMIRKNKKRLIEQENKLLKNLYELDLSNSSDANNPAAYRINQRELEEKISKNNELKKQLENLKQQQAELKKETLQHSRFKSFMNKFQDNNISKNKTKKQQIAVPDQELEEIFKSLDLD